MLFRSLELKGVAKIVLGPGATGTASLQLPVSELAFPGADLKPALETGEVEIFAGPCADPARLLSSRVMVRG
mgnify:CR=1 FL=1